MKKFINTALFALIASISANDAYCAYAREFPKQFSHEYYVQNAGKYGLPSLAVEEFPREGMIHYSRPLPGPIIEEAQPIRTLDEAMAERRKAEADDFRFYKVLGDEKASQLYKTRNAIAKLALAAGYDSRLLDDDIFGTPMPESERPIQVQIDELRSEAIERHKLAKNIEELLEKEQQEPGLDI